MSDSHENYRDREQTYIKHQFLRRYVQKAALMILQKRKEKIFNFVDGLAGPWSASDRIDYSDTSFVLAVETLTEVLTFLGNRVPGLKIRFCFCEKGKNAAVQLRMAVALLQEKYKSRINIETRVIQGLFEEHLEEIANFCNGGFTFTFIDPTGWNIDSLPILDFLKSQRGEFLLNFMEEHVNRHAGYSKVSKSFVRFLADPDWEYQFRRLPQKWSDGERVLCLLRKRIKELGTARYIPDFPIYRQPSGNTPRLYLPGSRQVKMRLLLGTNNEKGLDVFRDIQEDVEKQITKMRVENLNADCLIPIALDEEIDLTQDTVGIGCAFFQRAAEKRIQQMLSKAGTLSFAEIAIDLLEHVSIRRTQIKDLANKLKKDGILEFQLPPGARKPQSDTRISLA